MNIKLSKVLVALVLSTSASAEVFNVKDYGAIGDGVSNDTDAFNATVTAASLTGGGTVYVPCGEYLIGKEMGAGAGFYSGIQITSSHISLLGEGRCSELHPVNSSGNAIVSICSSSTDSSCLDPVSISDVRISNLTFHDPDPFSHVGSEESHGIVAVKAESLVIENNYFIGIGDEAVDLQGGQDVTVRGNHFDSCPSIPSSSGAAISVSGSKHISIHDNSITNAPSSFSNRGIDIATNTEEVTSWINITNNRFLGNKYWAEIYLASGQADVEHVVISSNQIEADETAIAYAGSSFVKSDIRIVNNEISGSVAMDANNLLIADNSISGNFGNGMRVAGQNVKVVNNIVKDFPGSCIFIISPYTTGPLEFTGNSCLNTSSGNATVINFFAPHRLTGNIFIKDNILDAAIGSKDGIRGGVVNTVISGNTIKGVARGISGGGVISNNIITDSGEYGINVIQGGAQVTNNKIKGAGSRCIFIYAANDTVVSGNIVDDCGFYAINARGGSERSICMGNNAHNNSANVDISCDVMIGNIQPDN